MVAFFALLSLVSSGLCLLMAAVVYYSDSRKALNRAFALFCLFAGFWAFGEFMHRQADSLATAELWMRIVGVVWPLTVAFLFHSVMIFTGNTKGIKGKAIYFGIYGPAVAFGILAVATNYLNGVLVREYWGYTKTVPSGYPLLTVASAWAAVMAVLAFILCLRYFLKATGDTTKSQSKYMLIGLAVPIASGVLTEVVFPPMQVRIPELTTVSMLWTSFCFAYAMERHSLFVISNVTAANNIVSTMSDCLILLDNAGNAVAFNKATSDLLGYSEGELIGTPARSVFTNPHQEDGGINELIAGKPLRNRDFTLKKRSGETVPVIVSSSVLMDKKGSMAGVVCIARDITEHKAMEEAVHVSEEKLRAIYDSMKDGLVVTDRDIKVLQCNNAALEIAGMTREQVMGMPRFDVLMAEDRQKAMDSASKQATEMPSEKQSYRIQLPGGVVKHIELSVSALKDAAGSITGFVIVIRDVSERIKMEAEIQKILGEMKRSNTDLEQFAYVASHDLQEPLRMVASYVGLLAKRYKGKLDTEADEFIEFAVDGATRMQRMIQDLLTYSRVTTRGKELLPVELEVTFADAMDNLKLVIEENKATVTHDHLPKVLADASQIVSLFQNLVSNAVKFHGKEPLVIHVGCKEGPEEWTISVKDNGIGIDPKQFDRLFIIFQRLVTREQYPGTGIGLAVCKRTVERHGGRIWVESVGEGKGTTFLFTLPKKDFSKTAEVKPTATAAVPQSK